MNTSFWLSFFFIFNNNMVLRQTIMYTQPSESLGVKILLTSFEFDATSLCYSLLA